MFTVLVVSVAILLVCILIAKLSTPHDVDDEITSFDLSSSPTTSDEDYDEDEDFVFSDEYLTPKEKGDAFEDFVLRLITDNRFKLLDRTNDVVSSSGIYAESCKNPDFHIQQKRGNGKVDYYIECKYRSKWEDGMVTFEPWQISRYRKFQRENHRKVIIALGVGGSASEPSTLMLVPLDSIKNHTIFGTATEYCIKPNPLSLYHYIDKYFSALFYRNNQSEIKDKN